MKRVLKIFIIIIFLSILIILIKMNLKEKVVNNKDYLYDKVEEYLISQEHPHYNLETKESKPNYNVSDFKVFTDIAKLGIRESQNKTNVYVWALVESYYVQDGKLIVNSGSSIPYKFIFENDEIVDYKMPRDGSEYGKSLKEIFPPDIRIKLSESLVNGQKLSEEVNEYYSYLTNDEESQEQNKIETNTMQTEIIQTNTIGNTNEIGKETSEMINKIKLEVNGKELTVNLEDNSSSKALVEKLKENDIVIKAHDYGNFEKVGSLDFSLPTNDTKITTEPGDLILYQGNQITLYYDTNTWSFTKLGKVEDLSKEDLKKLLGTSDVTITLSLFD